METRARYVLVGLFAIAVIVAGFGFVYWLKNLGGLGEQTTYRVRFESAVPGLRPGSSVLFNGIRVGEVTQLRLDAAQPRQVVATIVIQASTPVRADTVVNVETQGLMAAPSITLRGGAPTAPALPRSAGEAPMLVADPAAGLDTMTAARDVLRRIDSLVADNAEPVKDTIANLKTFSDALARNSNRIDGILSGVERMTGGGTQPPPPAVYDLTAPQNFPGLDTAPKAQLSIAEVTAVIALDSTQIGLLEAGGSLGAVPNAKWADTLGKLVQARVAQSFENAGFAGVGKSLDGFMADQQLAVDLRKFRVRTSDQTAEVEFGAKLLRDGKIVESRVFSADTKASGTDAAAVSSALDEAFGKAVVALVAWTAKTMDQEKN